MICANCEQLPEPLPSRGTLYLAAPLAHTIGKVRAGLRAQAQAFDEPVPGVLRIPLEDGGLSRLSPWLEKHLSTPEQRDTRSLYCRSDASPGLTELMQMDSLASLLGQLRGAWLAEILAADRLVTHFQPIVRAADPKQIVAYECLLRANGVDGKLIGAPTLLDAARAGGLLFQLDHAARLKSIESAHRFGVQAQLFINFLPSAIYDPTFCLRTTIAAIEDAGIRPSQVVFEVVESEEMADPAHLSNIVRHYRERGFRLALDDMGAGYSSLNLMTQLRPDVIKLDMGLVRGVDQDPYKASVAGKLLEMGHELRVIMLGEGVETQGEFEWLRAHGVQLVQGWLFAKAASPPPGVASLA